MKKFAFLLTIFCFGMFMGVTGQNRLNSFSELMEALKLGKEVKAVIHYAGCQLISDNAQTFEVQMDENFFGEMNDGKNEASDFFYEVK